MKCDHCGAHMRLDKRECSDSCCSDWYECDICRRVKLTSAPRDQEHLNSHKVDHAIIDHKSASQVSVDFHLHTRLPEPHDIENRYDPETARELDLNNLSADTI